MRLLIVEDDNVQVQLYIDVIESFNKENSLDIVTTTIDNIEQAQLALLNPAFDAAIIDLKLVNGSDELQGLELIKSIQNKLRFPVFVVSGSIAQIDDIEESSFLKKRLRDGDFKLVLSEAFKIFQTGITQILGAKGTIEDHLNSIFWEHLSTSMDIWIDDAVRSPEQKQKTLLRYILLHIQEYLELTTESNFEDYHPAEIYITPPIKNMIFTGDILLENETQKRYIVLTPSCDLAHEGKTESVLLVEIEEKNKGQINELKNIINNPELGKDKKNNALAKLKNLIKNNIPKYHFLPDYKTINSGLIDFQLLKSINKEIITDQYTRLASVNSSFTKDIVARFSFYYSRQGSPDFNADEVLETLLK